MALNIRLMLQGSVPDFDQGILDLSELSHFQREVLLRVGRIPRGEVSTYGEIASVAGRRQAARAVGGAIASNPFPLVIPCHRVIRSDGGIGGYQGGTGMKRILLQMEGVSL